MEGVIHFSSDSCVAKLSGIAVAFVSLLGDHIKAEELVVAI